MHAQAVKSNSMMRIPTSKTGVGIARARHKISEMTGGKCFYCGTPVICDTMPSTRDWLILRKASHKLAREHKIPVSRGGTDDRSNFVPACVACNNDKGSFTIDEYRFIRALRAGDIDFVFPFEPPRAQKRDWLVCHSTGPFERALVVHNKLRSAVGYALRTKKSVWNRTAKRA